MIDGTGREFNDHLTTFLEWFLKAEDFKGFPLYIPVKDSIHFSGTAGPDPHSASGVVGLTIFRQKDFQVQLFTCTPNGIIPPHTHPNVDSYEVALRGMEFYLEDKTILHDWESVFEDFRPGQQGQCMAKYYTVRVLPDAVHGAKAHKDGGCFMSVQHWLNGVPPSSVGNDWVREEHNITYPLKDDHSNQSTETD